MRVSSSRRVWLLQDVGGRPAHSQARGALAWSRSRIGQVNVRSLAYRTDLLIRRLAGSVIVDHPSHLVVRTPANPHFWWGNFVLVRPGRLPKAPDLFAAEFPEASHLAIGVDGTEGEAGEHAEWERL